MTGESGASGAPDEVRFGSDAWFDRRERLWNEKAQRLVRKLERYEDDHPKGAVCLIKAMDEARAAVAASSDSTTTGGTT